MKRFSVIGIWGVMSVIALTSVSCTEMGNSTSGTSDNSADTSSGQANSQMAPDFSLANLAGETVSLSDYKGKVILLDFWATWCPPCRKEIPDFVNLQDEYGAKGLQIVGISLDQDGVQVVKDFAEEFGINYPVLMGNSKVKADYGGIRGIPTTFLISRKGEIIDKYVGFRDKSVFEEAIKSLL
jgi:peroxiredoxin